MFSRQPRDLRRPNAISDLPKQSTHDLGFLAIRHPLLGPGISDIAERRSPSDAAAMSDQSGARVFDPAENHLPLKFGER